MTTDTVKKTPKHEAKKSKTTERKRTAARDEELTDEQLRNISGGGGEPTIVRD